MKVFIENYNGVLDSVEDSLDKSDELTHNPHEADIFLLWQDIRGTCLELAHTVKYHLNKPLIVMQHGRGAVRDYGEPNKFELLADKILVWGETEKDRLLRYGISADRIGVTGCPMLQRLKLKQKREGKNVLFVPVIAQKEEPENILAYAALKKWESEKLIKTITSRFGEFKRAWAWQNDELREVTLPDGTKERRLWKRQVLPRLPRWVTYGSGLVNVKLSGVHDPYQYQSPILTTPQNDPGLIDDIAELLSNTDVMVCLEEGTMQLMAAAMNIPVIVADIFRYENYGGCKEYDRIEKIHTNSCYWTRDINKLGGLIDHALQCPNELSKYRKIVCQLEGGSHLGDVNANIIGSLRAIVERPQAVVA